MSDASPRPLTTTAPVERFFGYYPGVPTVVTAAHEADRNLLAVGWHAALSSDPPMYGVAIAAARYTHGLGVAAGAFAVHFLPFTKAREIAGVGTLSKHQGVDKFARFELSATPGVATGAPILQDAYLAYECRLRQRLQTGDHEWWVGEVVAMHHDPDAFDQRGIQRRDAAPAPVYYGRATYESLGAGELAVFPPGTFRDPGDEG